MNLIKSFGDIAVSFNSNGYLNATQIAKQFDKRVQHYLSTERTQEYITALSEHLSKAEKTALKENQLVIIKKGGNVHFSGTWLHPKLAVDFARWLDPKFAVWCDEQIEQIISGSLKLETTSTVNLSERDWRSLQAVVSFFPYLLAYYHRTEPAILCLNRQLTNKVHDRFQDGYLHACYLADSLGIPHKSWQMALDDIG